MSGSIPPQAWSAAELANLAVVDRAVAEGPASVPKLVGMLTEPSWVVRRGVVRGLAALGDAAADALVEVLRSARDDETRIAAAVEALVQSSSDPERKLAELVKISEPAVVCDAVHVLGRRRARGAIPLLGPLVDGADDNVAVAAIEALGRIGGSAAVDTLVAVALSDKFFRVFPAIDALGRAADPRTVAPLASLLNAPLYALEAARALARTGEGGAVAPLVRLLSGRGDASARTAAVGLAELHERAEERYGSSAAVVRALRSLSDVPAVARRLSHSLRDAAPNEKAAVCVVLGSLGSRESVAILTELVEEPPPVGPAATRALERLSPDAQSDMARALRDGGSAQRQALLPLVARTEDTPFVEACLSDPDGAVRQAACAALGRLGKPKQVALLFERLSDVDPAVVQAAVSAIQCLGGSETEARALELSRSPAGTLRRAALRILSYFGFPSAFDAMSAATEDADPRVRDAGIAGLSMIEGEDATRLLLDASASNDARARAAAMKALGQRSAEPRVVASLTSALADSDGWVRYYACQALGKLGVHEAVPEIENLLGDPAGQVRVGALEALAHLGGETARRVLLDAARAEDEDLRRAALVGLGLTRHPAAIDVLSSAAESPDPMTRLIAVSTISGFAGDLALAVLARAAGDSDEAVRTAALGCLSARPGDDATAALIAMLRQDEQAERVVAALASDHRNRVPAIVSALKSADEPLARHLVSVLARVKTEEARLALLDAITASSSVVRLAAATALGALGGDAALKALKRAAMEDPDEVIRRVAALLARS